MRSDFSLNIQHIWYSGVFCIDTPADEGDITINITEHLVFTVITITHTTNIEGQA